MLFKCRSLIELTESVDAWAIKYPKIDMWARIIFVLSHLPFTFFTSGSSSIIILVFLIYFNMAIVTYKFKVGQILNVVPLILLEVPLLCLGIPILIILNFWINSWEDASAEDTLRHLRQRRRELRQEQLRIDQQRNDLEDSIARFISPRNQRQNVYRNNNEIDLNSAIKKLKRIRKPKVRKVSSFQAANLIFKKWRRGNSIVPYVQESWWPIWLSDFKLDEIVIQLKCSMSHCFHYNCMNEWIKRENKTWPIWRTDFIQVAKQEWANAHFDKSVSIRLVSLENWA